MTWDTRFRMLAEGEIVQKGDEVDACADGWRDPPDWQPATYMSIGKLAPDPRYPAHRRFRRRISNGKLTGSMNPFVVCLCGSTRFRKEFAEMNRQQTMEGRIVLAPGVFAHDGDPLSDEDKERLNELHRHKIRLADGVIVINPGGYIRDSTRREIEYAETVGVPVRYTHNDRLDRTVKAGEEDCHE